MGDAGRGRAVWVGFVLLLGLGVLLSTTPAAAGPSHGRVSTQGAGALVDDEDAERQLAERYAPVVVVRTQPVQCGDGEPYVPTDVGLVLGRPGVVLRTPTGVVQAPTAADLFAAPATSNLDLPGAVLSPGCSYEQLADSLGQRARPTAYARVVPQGSSLVLQYWLWWVYNDWNDRHEGDWEMVQLVFDAADAEAALATVPRLTAYAQHEGAELAEWDDVDKLARLDGHPVVYPGRGSHAAYYTQAVWFGRSASTGFGCDDTSAPGTILRPRVELLPQSVPTSASDPYAWLAFRGHWGQQAPSFNNGPTGPATKEQWAAPLTWVEDKGRPSAVAIPPVPGAAAEGFCAMVTGGSLLFLEVLDQPWLVAGVALLLLVAVVALARRTRWRGGSAEPDRERHTGQIIVDQVRVAASLRVQLLPVSLVLFAVTVAGSFVAQWVVSPGVDASITDVRGTSVTWPGVVAALAVGLVQLVVQAAAVAVVLGLVSQRAVGRPPSVADAARALVRRPVPAVVYLLGSSLLAALLGTFFLIPLGLVLLSMWCVSFAAAVVEGLGVRASFGRSRSLTRRRRTKSTMLALLLLLSASLAGPVLGGLLLLLTGWPVVVCNVLAAALASLLVTVPSIGIGLLFYDLRHEATTQAARPTPAPTGPGVNRRG